MTPRERILKALKHERPDRTPAVLAGRPEVDRALMAHFGVPSMPEVHKILGTDGWSGAGVSLDFSAFRERARDRLEGDFPYAGRRCILHDERTFEDEWGVIRRVGRDRKYVEWISGPLMDATTVDDNSFPGPERIVEPPDLAERVQRQKDQGLFVRAGITMPYKTAWELRGMENLLRDYVANPGFVEDLYDRIFLLYGEMARRAVRAGVDMLCIGGDIAMQDRVIVGPRNWRRIDKPRLARLIADCRALNPEVFVYLHSDGDLRALMPDLIEIGFNVIDPIQPECMDPVEIKRLYGDRIVLHGCGSLQRTLPFGTVAEVRAEVEGLIRNCGYNGGLVLRVANAIGFDCPLPNVLAFFETARDFDLSAL